MTYTPSAASSALATSSAAACVASRTRSASPCSWSTLKPTARLWGNTYKGKLDDIFDIQEQVAQQIVEALKLKLSFSEKVSLTKRQTVNAQAYDLYLRGQDYLYRLNKRSVEYAIQLFEKAIELDPRYAAAYAGCSSAYGQMYQWFARDDTVPRAGAGIQLQGADVRRQPAGSLHRDGAVVLHLGQARRKPAPRAARPSSSIRTISSPTGHSAGSISPVANWSRLMPCSSA